MLNANASKPVLVRRCVNRAARVRQLTKRSASLPKRPRNLQKLLGKTVRGMPTMFQRMTIWTQHFQVAQFVVATVSIFMVHTKNLWCGVIPTAFARRQHVSFNHVFAYRCEFWPPHFFSCFINACTRTILAFCRRRIQKINSTMNAVVLHSAFFMHSFVVALRAAILCFIGAARNVLKIRPAFSANSTHLHSRGKSHTLPSTILRSVFSVLRHCKIGLAVLADNRVPDSGACCATH